MAIWEIRLYLAGGGEPLEVLRGETANYSVFFPKLYVPGEGFP